MFKNILVVCMGNICRSPVAEELLRKRLGDRVTVTSAGIGALVGAPAEQRIVDIMMERGFDISFHRGKQLTVEMIRSSDLVLVMEQAHVEALTALAPESRGKTKLIGHWLSKTEVPDPYKKSDDVVNISLDIIFDSVGSWLKYLV